jgi:hypothetical protein
MRSVIAAADADCWLWAALKEKAMPSSARAKMLIAKWTRIMTLNTLSKTTRRYATRLRAIFCDRHHVLSFCGWRL